MRPPRGVVHALRNMHATLAPDGLLVDTQPVSPHPPVLTRDIELGRPDMREWVNPIRAVDERFAETTAAGLYELQHEEQFTVTDSFDSGGECLETVNSWLGTRVPTSLATRLKAAQATVTVEQEVRLRLLRRLTATPSRRRRPA